MELIFTSAFAIYRELVYSLCERIWDNEKYYPRWFEESRILVSCSPRGFQTISPISDFLRELSE